MYRLKCYTLVFGAWQRLQQWWERKNSCGSDRRMNVNNFKINEVGSMFPEKDGSMLFREAWIPKWLFYWRNMYALGVLHVTNVEHCNTCSPNGLGSTYCMTAKYLKRIVFRQWVWARFRAKAWTYTLSWYAQEQFACHTISRSSTINHIKKLHGPWLHKAFDCVECQEVIRIPRNSAPLR